MLTSIGRPIAEIISLLVCIWNSTPCCLDPAGEPHRHQSLVHASAQERRDELRSINGTTGSCLFTISIEPLALFRVSDTHTHSHSMSKGGQQLTCEDATAYYRGNLCNPNHLQLNPRLTGIIKKCPLGFLVGFLSRSLACFFSKFVHAYNTMSCG